MKQLISRHRYYLFLAGIFIGAELLVCPDGEFPLNDDWAYTKSIQLLHHTGKVNIGEWPAMTLLTHLLWGYLFSGTFGFSFFILRLSTMVSALAGALFLFRLIEKSTTNRPIAFIAALAVMFNPLYFNLANTYMTDVSFNTLLVMGIYYGYRYFITGRRVYAVIVMIVSVLIVLLRQFGLILPLSFLAAAMFTGDRKWRNAAWATSILAVVAGALLFYQEYLRGILPSTANYKYVGDPNISGLPFWTRGSMNFFSRWDTMLLHPLFYAFPVALPMFLSRIRNVRDKRSAGVLLASIGSCLLLFWSTLPQMGNVFEDMSVGAETSYEVLNATFIDHKHTWSPVFNGLLMPVLKILFSSVTFFAFLSVATGRGGNTPPGYKPLGAMLFSCMAAYSGLLIISDSYFDRYHIPLITLFIVFLCIAYPHIRAGVAVPAIVLVAWFYVSVAGTRDYFTVNRLRWEAYDYLRRNHGAKTDKINAGFEINCWNEGRLTWWQNFLTLDGYDYLIQYNNEPGFSPMKAYPFRRWFPPKEDKINIFVRTEKKRQDDR